MTEKTLSNRVREGLRRAARLTPHPVLEWERHESSTIRSVPDVRMRWASFSPWVELKIAHGRQIRFQPGQTTWLMRQWRAEPGTAWVLVGIPPNSRRPNAIALYRGEQAEDLAAMGLRTDAELLIRAPVLSVEPWGELLDRLTWGGCYCGCTEGTARGV